MTNSLTRIEFKVIIKESRNENWFRARLNEENVDRATNIFKNNVLQTILITKKDNGIHILAKTNSFEEKQFLESILGAKVKPCQNFFRSFRYICKSANCCVSSNILLLSAMKAIICNFVSEN